MEVILTRSTPHYGSMKQPSRLLEPACRNNPLMPFMRIKGIRWTSHRAFNHHFVAAARSSVKTVVPLRKTVTVPVDWLTVIAMHNV